MIDSQLQEPKYVRSKLSHNGWLGRGSLQAAVL